MYKNSSNFSSIHPWDEIDFENYRLIAGLNFYQYVIILAEMYWKVLILGMKTVINQKNYLGIFLHE